MNQSFTPVRVGRYILPNRLVMAPMTRSRAKFDGTPQELAAEYYAQRAGVGLIVAEGTQPSDDGQGYLTTPGIYTPAHIAGWKKVTAAVHDKGGSSSRSCMRGVCRTRTIRRIIVKPWHPPRSRRRLRCSPRAGCRTFPRRAR
jgi:hypothetical protein